MASKQLETQSKETKDWGWTRKDQGVTVRWDGTGFDVAEVLASNAHLEGSNGESGACSGERMGNGGF